jgi:L-alanine-DL-glutamate epimerase-like enolase superfamily enzyme
MNALPRNQSAPLPELYTRLAGLGLVVEGYETERHELDVSSGFLRVTTVVVLRGGGHEGRGEDVTYAAEDHDPYPLALPLAGEWTLDEFSQRLGGLDLFPDRAPQQAFFRNYRRWAFESAALDLALRQQGQSLGAALGRDYHPLRFAVSTRLDIQPWLAVDPALEFKLDPTPEWDAGLMADIAATGRVRVLDFKAFYEGSPVDNPPDSVQYRAAAAAFPDAILEDPTLAGPARDALDGEERRFSFDAPIHSWADVQAVSARAFAGRPSALRHLNIKPSRFGSLSALLDCVERAQAAGMELYGGGQFELGVGRDQIQALASLLYSAGPNDVAPRDFHGEAHAGAPRSPLEPLAQAPGFGFAFRR